MDKDFYNECSQEAVLNFEKYYSEQKFNEWKSNFFLNIDKFIENYE